MASLSRSIIIISLLIVAFSGSRFIIKTNRYSADRTSFRLLRYQAALWISENLPPDQVYAAWSAGELGYFLNRTLINLDGLINNVEYYERVLKSDAKTQALFDYLIENEVKYIVDYEDNEITSRLPVVKAFPIHETGRHLRIWHVPPDITSHQRQN